MLEALEVVHRAGALHRDIKPGNIFVRRPDDISGCPAQPVLIDFGAAKQNYLARHSRSQAPYTPGYAAYEQISSEGDIGPWTDIYAVGALMWRMLAGGCPKDERLFVTESSEGTEGAGVWSPTPRAAENRAYALHRGRPDPMVPAAELGASRFSQSLLRAIDRCLALYPDDRVRSCVTLLELLHPHTKQVSEPSNTSTESAFANPALLELLIRLAMFHVEAGARTFPEFSRAMANNLNEIDQGLGDKLRKYFRGLYESIRHMPENEHATQMSATEQIEAWEAAKLK